MAFKPKKILSGVAQGGTPKMRPAPAIPRSIRHEEDYCPTCSNGEAQLTRVPDPSGKFECARCKRVRKDGKR